MNIQSNIGHNNPPSDLFVEATSIIDDLYGEASHWLDGGVAQTQQELDAVSKLLDMFRKATKQVDENRKVEKKPFDDAGKAVQAKYKPLLEKSETAQALCKKAMEPFLQEQERLRQQEAERARKEAEQAEREALEAAQSMDTLADAEQASEAITKAEDAQKLASDIAKSKVQAKGGGRAIGLRTVWETKLTNSTDAARHYWNTHKSEIEELLLSIAKREVRGGVREIPGFEITETKVL